MKNLVINKSVLHFSELTKDGILIAIRWVCMALFFYTAYAKIIDHDRFLEGLTRVHLISGIAVFLSFAVPIVEIITGILLLIPRTAKFGLYGFTTVMTAFTVYILSAIILEKELPCHCGGAVEKLTWSQHIWFNLAFIGLAIIAMRLFKLNNLKN